MHYFSVALSSALLLAASAVAQPPKPAVDINGDPLPTGAVARLGTTRFQPPSFTALALSPDGRTLAVLTADVGRGQRIEFMDVATGIRRNVPGPIADDFDRPGTMRHRFFGHDARIQFTPDGKELVFAEMDRVKVLDAATGRVARSVKDIGDTVPTFALSADGTQFAAQTERSRGDRSVGIWDTRTGNKLAALPAPGNKCKAIAFGRDGKRLLLWSVIPTIEDGAIRYDNQSKAVVACLDIAGRKTIGATDVGGSHHAALGPDGETVAVEAVQGRGIRVVHLPTGTQRCLIPVKDAQFVFLPEGKQILAIDGRGQAALWDAVSGNKVRDFEGTIADKNLEIVGISGDGKTAAVVEGGWDTSAVIHVWDIDSGKRSPKPPGHEGAVTCLAYTSDGRQLISGSADKTVRLWDAATGEHRRVVTTHVGPITAIALSPDGKLLASSSESGIIRLTRIADGVSVMELQGPPKGARSLAFSREGATLFAGGQSAELLGWRVANGEELVRRSAGTRGAVMAFGDGATLAVTASADFREEQEPEQLHVWDPRKEAPLRSIKLRHEDHGEVVCAAAVFTADGRFVASSQVSEYQGIRPSFGKAKLRLWERASGQEIRELSAAVTKVLAFSPDGRYLVAGRPGKSGHLAIGYAQELDVWDTATGKSVGTLPVTPACVAFSPDGSRVAAGGRDNTVLIWPAPKAERPAKPTAPSVSHRDAWWPELAGNAGGAYKALAQMVDAPEPAVALLRERLRPVVASDPTEVAKQVARLDSKSFAERDEASRTLKGLGEGAMHLIAKARETATSVESRRRLDDLLENLGATGPLVLRGHRAVAALEWIGTPAAREILRGLAAGAPGARLTTEARDALTRLGK